MTEYRRIAAADVGTDMQVHSEGRWWQVDQIVDDGRNTGTMTIAGRLVKANQYEPQGRARLVWIPITGLGVQARAGKPEATFVLIDDDRPTRVVLRPTYNRDPRPYVDGKGRRWMTKQTVAHQRIIELAEMFERQKAAS